MTSTHEGCPVWHGPMERGDGLPPLSVYDEMEEQRKLGSVLWADEGAGYYIFTRNEDIVTAFQTPATYSSRKLQAGVEIPFKMIPIMLDPPEHTKWRKALGSYFTPKRAEEMRPRVTAVANELIESFIDAGTCDFVRDFSTRFPTTIFLEFMGLPPGELDKFLAWNSRAMRGAQPDTPAAGDQIAAVLEVVEYLWTVVQQRRESPDLAGDDLISQSRNWLIDGEPPNDQDLLMCCLVIYMAGLDTVNAMLSYIFFHLATHPENRESIVRDPAVIPHAIEEMMRAHSIIKVGREVMVDHEVGGCPVRAGEIVMLPTMAAGRDPEAYSDAAEVRFDRETIRHNAFGAGPHRCLGSHLARVELEVALHEWHRRIPDYKVADLSVVTERSGQASGIDVLPLVW